MGSFFTTSSLLRLFDPTRVWFIFVLLTLFTLGLTGLGIVATSNAEMKRIAVLQREMLLRAHLGDLERRNYRAFVEGAGSDIRNLYLSIATPTEKFSFGVLPNRGQCSSGPVLLSAPRETINVELCRSNQSPVRALVLILVAFAVLSLTTLRVLHFAEKTAISRLVTFVRRSGVQLEGHQTLSGILSRIQQITEELAESRRREIAAARWSAIGQVTAQVAHDIRSPLSALNIISAQLHTLPADYQKLLRGTIDRIQNISADLLRMQNSEAEIPPRVVDAHTLISQLFSEKRLEWEHLTNVRLFSELDGSQSARVYVEPEAFQRVLSNLINNAVESIEERVGEVRVNAKMGSGKLTLTIRDSGKGIPSDVLSKLFSYGVSFNKVGGSGLGLAYARDCITRWEGTLRVESIVNEGTTVTIALPVRESDRE